MKLAFTPTDPATIGVEWELALVDVATGRRDADWLVGLLDVTERAGEVKVMPPGGLTLEEVGYPPDRDLAARASEARAVRTLQEAE